MFDKQAVVLKLCVHMLHTTYGEPVRNMETGLENTCITIHPSMIAICTGSTCWQFNDLEPYVFCAHLSLVCPEAIFQFLDSAESTFADDDSSSIASPVGVSSIGGVRVCVCVGMFFIRV